MGIMVRNSYGVFCELPDCDFCKKQFTTIDGTEWYCDCNPMPHIPGRSVMADVIQAAIEKDTGNGENQD